MKNKIPLIVGAVVAIALIVGVAVAVNNNSKSSNDMADMDMSSTSHDHDSSSSSSTSDDSASTANKIDISNFAYAPSSKAVKVGTTVTWTNSDSVEHDVVVDGGDGPKSELLGQGKSYSYTFNTAGSFSYHCSVHSSMNGTVVVTE